jgi:hypothetical protein
MVAAFRVAGRSVSVVILELRVVQTALERKANSIQREFTAIAEKLAELRRKWSEEEETERPKIVAAQEALKEQQLALAEEVNVWRDRLRAIETPRGEQALQATLQELLNCGDEEIAASVREAQRLMAMDPEEKAALLNQSLSSAPTTPVGRLLERARTAYDLRAGGSPTSRQRAAVEFANRTGIAQDDANLAELEQALGNTDPVIVEVAERTIVEILRFRALRVAELEISREATLRLAGWKNPLVVPVLIEILRTPRTGFITVDNELKEESNSASRLAALIALVEWRTREAQDAIRMSAFDRDPQIEKAAVRAMEAFPGDWSGNPSQEQTNS